MDMKNNSACMLGSVVKINVHIERMCCLTMDDYDFECDFYVYPNRKITVPKRDLLRKGEDDYIAVVDTSATGEGELMMKVTAMIPDDDCPGGMRKAMAGCPTGIKIRKGL